MLFVLVFALFFSSFKANVIHNGDFSSGSLPPWRCNGCDCHTGDKFLAVSERRATWAGPRQSLNPGAFSADQLQYLFNFSVQALQPMSGSWKLHVISGQEERYFPLFHQDFSSSDWTNWGVGLGINNMVLGADSVEIYFEATPETANFNLDNIVMEQYQPDDSWRDEANMRIEEIRKSDVMFNFIDVDATELSLEVEQLTHSFPFGQSVASMNIAECHDSGLDDNYCTYVKENFNWLVDGYRMKWKALEPHQGDFAVEIPDKLIAWAEGRDMTVRGHSLLWDKDQNNPSWTWPLSQTDFTQAVYKHIDQTLDHFDLLGVKHWDVINEMVDQGMENHTFYVDHSGDPDIRAKIHRHVKERYPNTLFYVNDYGVINDNFNRFSLFQQLVRDLLAAGAPVDGLGLQSHLHGHDFLDWVKMKERLDTLWEEFKLPIWITEFDWNGDQTADFGDHSRHAEILDSFYRLTFSHQAVDGILSWRMDTLDEENVPNKAGEAWVQLYHSEWRSNLVIRPTQRTTAAFRGFRGGYTVRIKRGEQVLGELDFQLDGDKTIDCFEDFFLETIECQQR